MFFVFVRLTVDRNLPLILHPTVLNKQVCGLTGDKLPVILLAGSEGGHTGGDVSVTAGLETTKLIIKYSDLISQPSLISVLSSFASNKTISGRYQCIHYIVINHSEQIIIPLSHLFLFLSWKIFFIVFTGNCC